MQPADQQLGVPLLGFALHNALQVAQREFAEPQPQAGLSVLLAGIKHRAGEHRPPLQQRGEQELLRELGIVLVEALFDRRVQVVDDLVQILKIFGGDFELGGFVQIVQAFVFGHDGTASARISSQLKQMRIGESEARNTLRQRWRLPTEVGGKMGGGILALLLPFAPQTATRMLLRSSGRH